MRPQSRGCGVLTLAALIGTIKLAQAQGSVPSSARLTGLEVRLKENRNDALGKFWKDLENAGAPIVEPVPGDPTHALVTFVWRGSALAKQVFIFPQIESPSATDKMKMNRLLDTDVWYKTYLLPNDSRFTYAFHEALAVVENDSPLKHVDQLRTDQFNRQRFEFPPHDSATSGTTMVLSLFETSHSLDRSWSIAKPMVPRGTVETKSVRSQILAAERRVWVYRPPVSATDKPSALLILFDGFDYLHEIPAPTILDNLLASKHIPNVVALLVDNPPESRTQDLFCSERFADFVAKELVPWVKAEYEVDATPDRSIIGGASLGGLAAACTALRYPDVFRNVLAQSGSFWWSPAGERSAEWVTRSFVSNRLLPIKFHLDVGVFEDVPAPNGITVTNLVANRHFRDVLLAKGYVVDYCEFSGGHEFVNWQTTLATGLIGLFKGVGYNLRQ